MKLYGSPSPFVRRIRLLLESNPKKIVYEFIPIDIYQGEGRETLRKVSPVLKVPVLVDGDVTVFDSRVIFAYLCAKGVHPVLDWPAQNTLTIIDAVTDSLVNGLLLKRSGVALTPETMLGQRHQERIERSLNVLEKMAAGKEFKAWDYRAMCLYSMMDWALFRDLLTFAQYPELQKFKATVASRAEVIATDPRRT